jgi:uncharacterized protein (TIRG00374 family)
VTIRTGTGDEPQRAAEGTGVQLTVQHKQALKTALRVAVGFGLALLLLHFTLSHTQADLWGNLKTANRALLGCAVLAYGAAVGVTTWRWYLLLRVQGVNLPPLDVARLTMIGTFFSMAIPGSVGGDLVKMAYIARRVTTHKAESILSIVVDRVMGMLGLFAIASAMILSHLGFLLRVGPENRLLQLTTFSVGIGCVGGIVVVVLVEVREALVRHPWVAGLIHWSARKLPVAIVTLVERLVAALELYRQARRAVATALLQSLLVHSLIALSLMSVGRALGESHLRASDYFLSMQVANAVAALPLTPSGVGTRDVTIAGFFGAMESSPAEIRGAIPVTLTLVILFWSLVGAAVFVLSRDRPRPTGVEAMGAVGEC